MNSTFKLVRKNEVRERTGTFESQFVDEAKQASIGVHYESSDVT